MNKYVFVTKEKIQKLVNLAYQKRDISMLELRHPVFTEENESFKKRIKRFL